MKAGLLRPEDLGRRSPPARGGGFLGFAWDGELRARTGPAAALAGAGFCEYQARG